MFRRFERSYWVVRDERRYDDDERAQSLRKSFRGRASQCQISKAYLSELVFSRHDMHAGGANGDPKVQRQVEAVWS